MRAEQIFLRYMPKRLGEAVIIFIGGVITP
jgi:hypothetical protein